MKSAKFVILPLSEIDSGPNVRVDDEGLNPLVESIRKHGVLQPITIVPTEDGKRAECLFGHRRLAAARLAGLTTIPCMARERGNEITRVLTQVAENRDRKNMTKLEEALSYQKLRKAGMTQQQIADAIGTTQTAVSAGLLLLGYPEPVRQAVHWRRIGIQEALSIPLDLAKATDGRTLAAILRRGPLSVRKWLREATDQAAREGRQLKPSRTTYVSLNLDRALELEVREAARARKVSTIEWVRRAVRAALDAQTARGDI